MTKATQRVLRELLADPADERYGLELCKALGLASGTVHPLLCKFEALGWLESHMEDVDMEDVDPVTEGRPRRRYFRFTPDGVGFAQAALVRPRHRGGPAAATSLICVRCNRVDHRDLPW